MKSICGEFWRNSPPIIITRELTLRSGRTHRTRARSNALAMLLHIRSLAGYTIVMLESSFWKRHLSMEGPDSGLRRTGLSSADCPGLEGQYHAKRCDRLEAMGHCSGMILT